MTRSPLVEAAGDYLTRGLQVIALTGKTPNVKVHQHGLKEPLEGGPESEADWEVIASVFEHPDTTGIGILTSYPYVVVDIDGEEGANQWLALIGQDPEGMIPHDGWTARTGRGLHLWFMTAQETGTIKLGAKLDLKGAGGYVAAPPSLHPDGHTYTWLIEPDDFAPPWVPPQLAERIAKHAEAAEASIRQAAYKRSVYRARDMEYGTTPDFSGILKKVAEGEEGNRNALLHWAAKSMADDAATDEQFEELRDTAIASGLTPVEVKRTIRSARRG